MDPTLQFLSGGGGMGERIRAFDWTVTPLGAPAQWPQSLRTALSMLLDSPFPMLIAWGPEFTQFYNDGYRPILGSTKHPGALGGTTPGTFPEIWHTIGPMFADVQAGRPTMLVDFLLPLDRDDFLEDCYFTFSYSSIREEGGAVGGVLVTVTETTERIVATRRLGTLQALASRMREARSAVGACALAAEVLEANPLDLPFAAIYLRDEDGRLRLAGAAGTADLSATRLVLAQLEEGPQPRPIDEMPMSVAGRSAFVMPIAEPGSGAGVSGYLVAGAGGRLRIDAAYRGFLALVAGHLGTAIAAARALEQAQARAEALAALDRAKIAFFSNISHEFRTPLTLMLAPLEESLERVHDPAERQRLTLAHRNAQRLQKLVNTLLDFSRIEAGRLRARFQPTGLSQLTTDLASSFRSACLNAGLDFEIACDPLSQPVRVDRDMWEKIVLNLLSNAFKFTFAGMIAIHLREQDGAAVLSVRDTGTGIPAAELTRIFDRFHRVEGARGRTHEGTGIGLALVHELVRLNGGTIAVESTVGVGTTFTIALPLSPLDAGVDSDPVEEEAGSGNRTAYALEAEQWAAPADTGSSASAERGATRSPSRILLADDNADMRGYLARLLSDTYVVEAVADGEAALAAARHTPPDLVISDVMMPRLDGFGLLHRLRGDERTRAIPVLLLTARAGEDARVEGLGHGADAYLTKPFSSRELLARIGALLEASRRRQETAAALREGEARFRDMADHAPMMVWVTEPDGSCSFLSRSWYEFTGQDADQGLGAGWVDALHPDDRTTMRDSFRSAQADRTPFREEYRVRRADGEYQWAIGAAAPRFTDDGRFLGYVGSVIDITDRKEAETRREQALDAERAARAELERVNRTKDEFLATLSHELRTPLHAILSWSDLLRDGPANPKELAEGLAAIGRNARLQSMLIEDLLDMSRIISGDVRLNFRLLRLADVIGSALQSIQPAAAAKQIRIVRTFDPRDGVVTGDPERLQQVFWNILGNAVKFTPAGGIIDISVTRVRNGVEVSIADTGEGIEPAFLPHVFERLRQGDGTTTRAHGGLGIGLSIVSQLVALHKGTVRATSPGRDLGSTFTVSLPMAMAKTTGVRTGEANVAVETGARFRGRRILVVDDDGEARAIARRILAGYQADVTVAGSAHEALAALAAGPFDLLISDIGMPDVDGYDLIRRLRTLAPSHGGTVPAIALTAYARPDDRERALRAGFQKHVAKPISRAELVTACASLLHP